MSHTKSIHECTVNLFMFKIYIESLVLPPSHVSAAPLTTTGELIISTKLKTKNRTARQCATWKQPLNHVEKCVSQCARSSVLRLRDCTYFVNLHSLNLRSLIFSLTPFGWFSYIYFCVCVCVFFSAFKHGDDNPSTAKKKKKTGHEYE